MRISDISVTLWTWAGIPPTRYANHIASGENGETQMGLVRIRTDEGLEGHAFLGSALAPAGRDAALLIDRYKPLLLGEDPFARGRLNQAMFRLARGQALRVIGAIDVALWDLAGKAAAQPLHQLLGSSREAVPVYASSPVLPSPEAYAAEALEFKQAGWPAYKIHPPAEPDLDIEVCQAVRRAVGDDFRLMLDSTWSYNFPAAMRVGRAIEELGFYWYEDPLAADDLYGYVKLKQRLDIPIMATEQPSVELTAYAPWILAKATDYLRGDVAVKGGLTACLKAAHVAEAFHMNYEVHHGGNSLNNAANLHLIAAIPNCEYFEVLLPAEAQKHGLLEDIEVDERGLVRPFDRPGLGAQIDFDLIDRMKTAELT